MANDQTLSKKQKFVSAFIASQADLLLTHPLETAAKLKQSSKVPANNSTFNIYKILKDPQLIKKGLDLYDGLFWSAANKLSSRSLRYLGQDYIQKEMQDRFMQFIPSFLNEAQRKAIIGATSGVAVAVAETTAFYPLDVIKTRKQLHAKHVEVYQHLYKGLTWTIMRNSFSAAAFFGSYTYFSHNDKNNLKNNLVASTKASLVTTVLNNPIEVIKTRMQAPASNSSTSFSEVVKAIAKEVAKDGIRPLMKGMVPRLFKAPIAVAVPYSAYKYGEAIFQEQNNKHEASQYKLKPT